MLYWEANMNSHHCEYKMLVEYVSPEEKGQFPHFSHMEDQEGLTKTLDEVFTHLPESIPEGWEINSHGITVSRDTLIIAVLLKRSIAQ